MSMVAIPRTVLNANGGHTKDCINANGGHSKDCINANGGHTKDCIKCQWWPYQELY